jgi:serine/threonine protein kinase
MTEISTIPHFIQRAYHSIERMGNQHTRAFSSVVSAVCNETGEKVIIKWTTKENTGSKAYQAIKNEAKFNFETDGLPKDTRLLEDESNCYLIRKFIEGIPFDAYGKSIPLKRRIQIVQHLVGGLIPLMDELKQQSIVHADIKPSNLIIQEQDGSLNVFLVDFGLAIQRDNLPDRKTLFPLGYAAPELILNQLQLVDHRTDLFSIGIVIWRFLAERLPLAHPNPSIFTNLQLAHPLPAHDNIPEAFYSILARACVKPTFRTAPNQMYEEDVADLLSDAMNNRYDSFDAFAEHVLSYTEKEPWWKKINISPFGNRERN